MEARTYMGSKRDCAGAAALRGGSHARGFLTGNGSFQRAPRRGLERILSVPMGILKFGSLYEFGVLQCRNPARPPEARPRGKGRRGPPRLLRCLAVLAIPTMSAVPTTTGVALAILPIFTVFTISVILAILTALAILAILGDLGDCSDVDDPGDLSDFPAIPVLVAFGGSGGLGDF